MIQKEEGGIFQNYTVWYHSWPDMAAERSELNWSKLRCSTDVKYTLDFEDADLKTRT